MSKRNKTQNNYFLDPQRIRLSLYSESEKLIGVNKHGMLLTEPTICLLNNSAFVFALGPIGVGLPILLRGLGQTDLFAQGLEAGIGAGLLVLGTLTLAMMLVQWRQKELQLLPGLLFVNATIAAAVTMLLLEHYHLVSSEVAFDVVPLSILFALVSLAVMVNVWDNNNHEKLKEAVSLHSQYLLYKGNTQPLDDLQIQENLELKQTASSKVEEAGEKLIPFDKKRPSFWHFGQRAARDQAVHDYLLALYSEVQQPGCSMSSVK